MRLALAILAAVALAACERTTLIAERLPVQAGDAGDAGCGGAGCPPTCYYDDDCPGDQRCDDATHGCVAAARCQDLPGDPTDGPSTCRQSGDEWAYCVEGSECRCLADARAEAPYTGFCKRRRPACAPCTDDEQCGSDPAFFRSARHNEANCVQADDADPTRYCLERFSTIEKCPCGKAVTRQGRVYCAPQEPNTCAQGGVFACCTADANCPPAHPACDPATGLCRDRCHFDFARGQTVGCRSDLVCNVDPALLDERLADYGAGRCAPPCAGDATCRRLSADFVCALEANGLRRCRPAGCIDDQECAEPPPSDPYVGFCDRRTGECVCDPDDAASECYCRAIDPATGERWADPRTGNAYDDCKPGFACGAAGTALNRCVAETCAEAGGAASACARGELCCGEDRNGNGRSDDDLCVESRATGALAPMGACYPAPRDVYCLACDGDADCRVAGMPVQTSAPADANRCVGSAGSALCKLACASLAECPAGFGCGYDRVTCRQGDALGCGGHPERCSVGPQTQPDGTVMAACACATPFSTSECAGGARCSNEGGVCVWGAFCQPPMVGGGSWCAATAH